MSGDPEQEYFADGLTEDIITGLSRQRWFFVIARNSSFAFKGETVDVRKVASELGVRYVLEGSVRKAASRVRVTGATDRRQQRRSSVGGPIRSRARRHLRIAGRDHQPRHRFGRAADHRRRSGARSAQAAAKHRCLGSGDAGAAAHVAHERGGAAAARRNCCNRRSRSIRNMRMPTRCWVGPIVSMFNLDARMPIGEFTDKALEAGRTCGGAR